MKYLFAGPWTGEFGWELFCWQGYLRKLKEKYDEIIVGCRIGHELLYQDFSEKIVIYNPKSTQTDMWNCRNEPPYDYNWFSKNVEILKPANFINTVQKFIKFGKLIKNDKFDLILHARKTNKCGTGYRDWPLNNWKALRDALKDYKVCSIGNKNAAMHIPNTKDLRGISLKKLSNILASSKLLIGPSSGPIHFGSLCGIPHIVWSPQTGYISNKVRYEKVWNPFNTKVTFIEASWQPSVETILTECRKIL